MARSGEDARELGWPSPPYAWRPTSHWIIILAMQFVSLGHIRKLMLITYVEVRRRNSCTSFLLLFKWRAGLGCRSRTRWKVILHWGFYWNVCLRECTRGSRQWEIETRRKLLRCNKIIYVYSSRRAVSFFWIASLARWNQAIHASIHLILLV